ncbi:hypothetical protein T02_4123 [Trichinella nativa]|uniref:Uncharacterized protein n=1 Tax=Trichinella nativa TaxID=6335 RepID=A0A0V1LLW1_9BILA|nr:hypothetical protein T02_4123 [Trichinella nativa]
MIEFHGPKKAHNVPLSTAKKSADQQPDQTSDKLVYSSPLLKHKRDTIESDDTEKNWGHQNGRPIPTITLLWMLCREKTIHNGPASTTGPQSTSTN